MNLGFAPRLTPKVLLFKECRRRLRYAVYKIGRDKCKYQKGFGEKIDIHELRGNLSKKDLPFILSCGYGFSFICGLGTNHLFSEGVNFHGQLGTGYRANIPVQDEDEAYSNDFAEVRLRSGGEAETVLGLACGRAHSVVITKSGVFAMGLNTLGQCATSSKDHVLPFPKKLHLPPHAGSPQKVCCGFDHTVLLTDQGQVFTSGLGTDGQTGIKVSRYQGLGSLGCHYEFEEVQFPVDRNRILNIAAGADNSLALTEDGLLFGWGNNEYRQISSAVEEDQVPAPLVIPFEHRDYIADLQCGGTFIALHTVKQQLFLKGFTIFSNQRSVKYDQDFHLVYLNRPLNFGTVKCGTDYVAIKTESSGLLTLGFQERIAPRGKLDAAGNDTSSGLLTLPGEIIDFACGVDHILALVETN